MSLIHEPSHPGRRQPEWVAEGHSIQLRPDWKYRGLVGLDGVTNSTEGGDDGDLGSFRSTLRLNEAGTQLA